MVLAKRILEPLTAFQQQMRSQPFANLFVPFGH